MRSLLPKKEIFVLCMYQILSPRKLMLDGQHGETTTCRLWSCIPSTVHGQSKKSPVTMDKPRNILNGIRKRENLFRIAKSSQFWQTFRSYKI